MSVCVSVGGVNLTAAGGGVGVLPGALCDIEAGELLGHGRVDTHCVHQLLHCDAASETRVTLVCDVTLPVGQIVKRRL